MSNAPRKSFRGYVPATSPEFDLESPDGTRVLTVHCKPNVPGSKFLDFLSKSQNAEEDPGVMAQAVWDVLGAAIVEDEWDAFRAFIDAPENGMDLEALSEIAGYLAELFSGRPSEPSPV